MKPPGIKHVVRDETRNITYKLWAYRKLNAREVQFHTRHCISMMKKTPTKNSSYNFITVIGATDRI